MMIYSFICPAPCNNKIVVFTDNYDDAATKLVDAGALRCRNDRYGCYCEKSWHEMASIPEDQLKNIVKMCMQEETEKPKDNKYISSSLYS